MTSRASDDVFFLISACICRRVCHMLHDCSSVVLGFRSLGWALGRSTSCYPFTIWSLIIAENGAFIWQFIICLQMIQIYSNIELHDIIILFCFPSLHLEGIKEANGPNGLILSLLFPICLLSCHYFCWESRPSAIASIRVNYGYAQSPQGPAS